MTTEKVNINEHQCGGQKGCGTIDNMIMMISAIYNNRRLNRKIFCYFAYEYKYKCFDKIMESWNKGGRSIHIIWNKQIIKHCDKKNSGRNKQTVLQCMRLWNKVPYFVKNLQCGNKMYVWHRGRNINTNHPGTYYMKKILMWPGRDRKGSEIIIHILLQGSFKYISRINSERTNCRRLYQQVI